MVDTVRTLSDLTDTLFVDGQPVASITPQDIRDLIVSLAQPFGGCYVSTPAGTVISTPGTFEKAAGTTTSTSLRNMTMPANNRLTYTGAAAREFHVNGAVSLTSTGTNDNISLAFAKNGTVITHSIQTGFDATGSDQVTVPIFADANLSTNDFLEIYLTNEDAAETITLQQAYFFAIGIII